MGYARVSGILSAFAALANMSLAGKVFGQEIEREFCIESDCQAIGCMCSDDVLEIVFEGDLTSSVFEYDLLTPDRRVPSVALIDVKTSDIRGLSFGVAHDGTRLDLAQSDLRVAGTLKDVVGTQGFLALRRANAAGDPGAEDGYVFGALFGSSADRPVVLPRRRVPLVSATYTLRGDGGPQGERLVFSDRLGNPPVAIVLAVDVFGPPEAESPECSDGLDNDGDGQLDGEDPDCQRVQAEPPEADCADGVDNDADGRVDLEDRGCASRIALSMAPRKLVDGLILGVASPGGGAGETFAFHRADANGDGKGNITDAVYLLNYLHVPGLEPVCLEAADVDDDGAVGAADVIFLLSWLFVDGERPPPSPGPWPFPCGPDPVTSPRMLGCKAYSGC